MNDTKRKRKASDGNKVWRVRLAMCESAIRKQDEYVFKHSPRFVDIIVKHTSVRVQKNGQTETLETLVKRCPQRELLYLLGMCENRGVTNAMRMTGYDSDKLPQKMRDLKQCAAVIERVNGHAVPEGWGGTEFGKMLEMSQEKRGGVGRIGSFLQLPTCIRDYASLVSHATKYLGGKSDFYLSLAKAILVNSIREHTGDDHPKEVANLLSVMLGLEYAEVEHRVWQNNYSERFNQYQPDPSDSSSLRAMKTLLECDAAILYRMDVLHSGTKHLRHLRKTVLRVSDLE